MRDGRQPVTVDQPVGKAVDMRHAILDRAGHGDRMPAEVAEAGAFDDQVLDRFLTRPAIHQFDREPGAQMCALAGSVGLSGRRDLADLRVRPGEAGQRVPDGLRLEPAVYAPLVPRLYDDGPGAHDLGYLLSRTEHGEQEGDLRIGNARRGYRTGRSRQG